MNDTKEINVRESMDNILKGGMGLMLLLLFLFLAAVVMYPASVILSAIIYGILNLSLTAGMYHIISGRISGTLQKISFLIEELTAGREERIFPVAEDTILSKLQVQLMKLYEILHSYEEREQRLRKQISENIGDLVHQINTPITNIQMYTQFLEDKGLTEEERTDFIRRIRNQAEKLVWLGEGFSKVSRLETGIIQLKVKRQKLFPVLLQAVNQVLLKAEEKEMNIIISGEKESYADIDGKWTTEAIYNILDNAVKYGNRNTEIEVRLKDMVSFVCICVKNEGIAIKEEEFNLIFSRFYRGKAAAFREGVGLGLYLAREILTGQKGYIKVSRDKEEKTVFELYFYKMSNCQEGQ